MHWKRGEIPAKKNKNNEEQLTNNSLTGHTMLHSTCPSIQTILPTLKKVQRRCCDDATNGSICTTLGCESNGAQNKNALRATEVQEKTKLRISECPTKNWRIHGRTQILIFWLRNNARRWLPITSTEVLPRSSNRCCERLLSHGRHGLFWKDAVHIPWSTRWRAKNQRTTRRPSNWPRPDSRSNPLQM